MERKDPESSLTPAARKVLEELVDGYRSEILLQAQRSASRWGGDYHEVSVHDVITALDSVRADRLGVRPSSQDRTLMLLAGGGAAAGILALVYYAFTRLIKTSSSLLSPENLALYTGIVGLYTALVAAFVQRLRRRRLLRGTTISSDAESDDFQALELAVVQRWRDIELRLRDMAAAKHGESASAVPLSRLIETLFRDGALSPSDNDVIRRLLELRNSVLHERAAIPRQELVGALKAADQLLEHLGREGPHRRTLAPA